MLSCFPHCSRRGFTALLPRRWCPMQEGGGAGAMALGADLPDSVAEDYLLNAAGEHMDDISRMVRGLGRGGVCDEMTDVVYNQPAQPRQERAEATVRIRARPANRGGEHMEDISRIAGCAEAAMEKWEGDRA